ncbi:MAG: ribosome-associated translation inhibitor RaiA [Lysobacterales bacterium]
MRIDVKGRQIDVTPALDKYAKNRFKRLGQRFDQLQELTIVLSIEKVEHKAEATLQLPGRMLHAVATAPDMYAAIDMLAEKVDAQVKKFKEKQTAHHAETVRTTRYG